MQFVIDALARSQRQRFLQRAEDILVRDLQTSRIVALGRAQDGFNLNNPKSTLHSAICYRHLLGEVILPGPMVPPKWLLARFGCDRGSDMIWYDPLVPAEQVRHLHPEPLIKIPGTAGDHTAGKKRAKSGPKPGSIARYRSEDVKLYPEIVALMTGKPPMSCTAATKRLADQGRVAGTGTASNIAARLQRSFTRSRGTRSN
jgi:hypothetical protein